MQQPHREVQPPRKALCALFNSVNLQPRRLPILVVFGLEPVVAIPFEVAVQVPLVHDQQLRIGSLQTFARAALPLHAGSLLARQHALGHLARQGGHGIGQTNGVQQFVERGVYLLR
ncbi:MAG: hypothetical protein AAGJ10_12015 [Bacteroidota bacterium]